MVDRPEARRTDRTLAAAWREAHPRVLGALPDLLLQVLRYLDEARDKLTARLRMADFAEVLEAVDIVRKTNALCAYPSATGSTATSPRRTRSRTPCSTS